MPVGGMMLDKKTNAVLQVIVETVGENYKVVPKSNILEQLPQRLGVDMQSLQSMISFLQNNQFVDVKYQDKEEICLAATVKALNYRQEEKASAMPTKITFKQIALLLGGVFLAAFLGALAAVFVGKLL